MALEDVLDLRRVDVLAAADDHVLLAPHDVDESLLVLAHHVAGVEPAAAEGLGRGLRGSCSTRASSWGRGRWPRPRFPRGTSRSASSTTRTSTQAMALPTEASFRGASEGLSMHTTGHISVWPKMSKILTLGKCLAKSLRVWVGRMAAPLVQIFKRRRVVLADVRRMQEEVGHSRDEEEGTALFILDEAQYLRRIEDLGGQDQRRACP